MSSRALLAGTWVCFLFLTFVPGAYADISDVVPSEGTVGTQFIISGSGFGTKHGKVLLGEEKCKVLSWSNTEISCELTKPQPPGEYPITVLLKGDKKPAEPLTFYAFSMRQPELFPGELAQEGGAVTVLGAFFGDKKGDIRLGYLEGGAGGDVVIESAKIVDWSMEAIRFEIPAGLVGKFVLKVGNQVGASYALLDLGGGTPLLGLGPPPPPGWPEGHGWKMRDVADGVWFKGKFYVFFHDSDSVRGEGEVRCKIFDLTTESFDPCPGTMPTMYTYTTPEAVVVKDAAGEDKELWLFHVTGSKTILFSRFDGSDWLWIPWAGGYSQTPPVLDWYVTDSTGFQPAAVFNPVTLGVTLYITYDTHINFATSSDGVTWVHSGAIYPYSDGSLRAVYHQGSVNGIPYDTLLAFEDNLNQKFVYYLKDGGSGGVVAQYILSRSGLVEIPDLVNLDDDPANGVAMLYPVEATVSAHAHAEMKTLGTNGAWSDPTTILTLPSEAPCFYHWGETYGYLVDDYVNNGSAALIYWPDGTRRIMFLYRYKDCTLFSPNNYFKMVDVLTLN